MLLLAAAVRNATCWDELLCMHWLHCVGSSCGVCVWRALQGWPRDRPYVFDVVSASALCEKGDYESSALLVGLAAAQAWATRLQARHTGCLVMIDITWCWWQVQAAL